MEIPRGKSKYDMNTTLQRLTLGVLMAGMGAGCTTAYDAYGYPRTVVDPGAAVVGAAAAGLIGYGIGRHQSRHHHDYDRHHHYARYSGHHRHRHH